jgi:Tfp pilus assembly protein PilN
MREMNLLPPWVVRKQTIRRWAFKLAGVQIVIAFIITAGFLLLAFSLGRAEQRSDALARNLLDTRYAEPDRVAALLAQAKSQSGQQAEFINSVNPSAFDYAWLAGINGALPGGAAITEIIIDGARITLSCAAADWLCAADYRNALLETGLFSRVRFGAFARTEGGGVRYELFAYPCEAGPARPENDALYVDDDDGGAG